MVRTLLNTFAAKQAAFPTALPAPRRVTLVTGRLMGELLPAEVLPRLNAIRNLHAELVVVNNTFYGESIGVSGLLTGQDIFRQLRTSGPGDCVFLPKNCVNAENVFLDDWTVSDLAEKLAVPVQPIGNDFAPIFGAAVQNEAQV